MWDPSSKHGHAFVVLKDDETVGVVLVEADEAVARVRLDYVTPRYRDLPGEFVWRRSGLLREHRFTRVVTRRDGRPVLRPPRLPRDGRSYVLDL